MGLVIHSRLNYRAIQYEQLAEHTNFAKLICKTHSILIFCALDQCILRCLPFHINWWFSADILVAMVVDGNKRVSLCWE